MNKNHKELIERLLEQEHNTIMDMLEAGDDVKTIAGVAYFVEDFILTLSEEDDDAEIGTDLE